MSEHFPATVEISPESTVIVEEETTQVITSIINVGLQGPVGPAGPAGPQGQPGPQGPAGSGGSVTGGIQVVDAAKVDGSVVYYDAAAATFRADATWTTDTLVDGANF